MVAMTKGKRRRRTTRGTAKAIGGTATATIVTPATIPGATWLWVPLPMKLHSKLSRGAKAHGVDLNTFLIRDVIPNSKYA